jgi:quercetin dioxygenase-like cupin family protein
LDIHFSVTCPPRTPPANAERISRQIINSGDGDMRLTTAIAVLITLAAGAASAQAQAQPALKWGPAPAIFPAGAQMAVLQGDPGGTGLFTVRLKLPNGYKIPPHTHPTDEHVTVISGTFRVGMGTIFDASKMMELTAGGFVTAPAQGAHFAVAEGATIVQVHALGPFAMTYVNPADTPHQASNK